MADPIIIPAVVMGLVIGFYELILVHKDENFRGSHWLSHGIHSGFFAVLFTFASMNVDYVLEFFPGLGDIGILSTALGIRLLIGIVAIIKIQAASAVVRGTGTSSRGLRESFVHTFIIAALIVTAPYVYPFIEPFFPDFLK